MSVLIRGMIMPDHCLRCPFIMSRDGDDCILQSEEANLTFEDWEQMRKSCPLVEVKTPHGKLIDAELLKNEFPHDADWDYPVNTNCYVCESIDNAPTVIEAEGE